MQTGLQISYNVLLIFLLSYYIALVYAMTCYSLDVATARFHFWAVLSSRNIMAIHTAIFSRTFRRAE